MQYIVENVKDFNLEDYLPSVKRPINDIRNEFENTNNKEDDNKDQNTN